MKLLAIRAAAAALAVMSLSSCASATYGVMEQFGIEKRDILVDRVDEARDAQADAKEQFADALEAFRAMVDVDGGELEKLYDKLNAEYKASENSADRVRERIKSVDQVARDLFKEWRSELNQYDDQSLRRISEAQLLQTEQRYEQLIAKMRQASDSMDPVLRVFHDRVLFLKHNLNASAIAALDNEKTRIEGDVADLIAAMERSIAEADAFISEMRSTSG